MAFHFWSMEPNFNEKGHQNSNLKNCHFDKSPGLQFGNFLELAILGNSTLDYYSSIDPSKLRTSQG